MQRLEGQNSQKSPWEKGLTDSENRATINKLTNVKEFKDSLTLYTPVNRDLWVSKGVSHIPAKGAGNIVSPPFP